ncbi:MAG: SusC/RagA family TonB-linked outer membrane protein [Cyclobacteriaceae bacterium]
MKRILLLSVSLLFVLGSALAQRTVSGRVTSDSDGGGVPGVNVLIKGTTTGVTTDLDGNYRISVPEDGATLVFSFIGLATQETEVGSRSVIDVSMAEDVETLAEVVVTGLGIVKEKKALGYGVTSVGAEALSNRQETDIARMLRGKATGVDITQTSGLAGSGTNVIIRGYSSITGTNQPLFVVDGIPFNTSTNTGGQGFGSGSATASSRFLDLDPNTIADVTILKGLSATVLYGEAGRNGVVLVTTKNGQAGANATKKMEVSLTQGVFRSEIANLPDYQNTYGNGFNAGFGWFFSNWGPAFDDTNPASYGSSFIRSEGDQVYITHPLDQGQYNDDVPEYIGVEYPYQPYESVENFFQAGLSSNTSLSIASNLGDNASISATYSYLTDEGFTPRLDELRENGRSNYIDKHNFGLGAQTKLQNGIKIRGSFNFVNTSRLTPITAPAFGGDGNGLFAAILFTPRSVDLMNLPYQSPIDGSNIYYRRGSPIQNPRWTLNNSGQTEDIQRFFSSTEASYEINENFSVMYRLSLDRYNQKNRRHINRGGPRVADGIMNTYNINNEVTDQILNVLYNFSLPNSITIDGIVGANARREVREQNTLFSSNQFVYNLLTHDNFIEHNSSSFMREENTLGMYGTATIGYNYYLFLNLQARNDWTSTLEQENRSVFYPSASVSFVPTDAIAAISNSSMLNYLKLRFGYGTSAGYPNPYSTRSVLESETNVFVSSGGTVMNINSVANFLGNSNLERELFKEAEVGVEARLINDQVSLDLSLFNKTSSDLIINLPLDPATGYTVTTVNAAEIQNKGIEAGLTYSVPLPGDLAWDISLNYTKVISTVNSIYEGIERVQVSGGGYTTLGNYAIPGEPYGAFYGSTFDKVEGGEFDGMLVVDNQGSFRGSGNFGIIGDPNPDYTANWMNSISWKGISFGFHWQYIHGGDLYSSTVQSLLARGNTSDTDFYRNIPIIMPNSVKIIGTDDAGDPIYAKNDIQTYMGDTFFDAYFGANEGGVFDATVVRLREISLGYVVPKSLIENTPFGTLGITISGENLFYHAPNFPEGLNFDPEISSVGVGNGRGFDFRTAPTAKKYGFTLTATF